MSRRTSEANRAIAKSWENEQKRVLEGKGTRNWNSDQQRDILDKGKAYDENGRAFEGHHMKSVEAYPEYQGDSENIQFLSREEHKAAHFGNFHTPTNGFYDSITGVTSDFGDGPYIPCRVIDLDNPIIAPHLDDTQQLSDGMIKQEARQKEQIKVESIKNVSLHSETGSSPMLRKAVTEMGSKARGILKYAGRIILTHPEEVMEVLIGGIHIVTGVKNAFDSEKSNKNNKSSTRVSPVVKKSSSEDIKDIISENLKETDTRSSPIEHTVQAHRQRYGKNKEWKDKAPYSRGGKKNT